MARPINRGPVLQLHGNIFLLFYSELYSMKILDVYFLACGHVSLFDSVLQIEKDGHDVVFNF